MLYTIKITNWNKYNPTIKKGHKATLISNNFCTDGKLGTLPVTVRWMFLGLILTCGDHTRDTIEMNEKQLRALLESSWSIERALDALQSLQLLSYTKKSILLNRKEKKRKEKNRIEKNIYVDVEKIEKDKTQNKLAILPTESAHPLLEIWNTHCGDLPKIRGLSSTRLKNANARWKENPDSNYWLQVVKKIVASDFCNGSEGKWIANFDWFVKPQTHLKVIEGNYDNRDKKGYYMTHGMKIAHNAKMIDKEINEVFGGFDEKDAKPV